MNIVDDSQALLVNFFNSTEFLDDEFEVIPFSDLIKNSGREISEWIEENQNIIKKVVTINIKKGLRELPEKIDMFTNARFFHLGDFSKIKNLPDSFGNLKLSSINLGIKNKLEKLPDTLRQMKSLVNVDLGDYNNFQLFPEVLCDLPNLQELSLGNHNKLQNLPDNIGKMRKLKVLRLGDFNILEELPDSLVEIPLHNLDCGPHNSLKKLPPSFEKLIPTLGAVRIGKGPLQNTPIEIGLIARRIRLY